MEMESESSKPKSMDHVILNEVNEMLQNDLQPIEQYDYITLDEMQPMEQDLVQYQDVEIQESMQTDNMIINEQDESQQHQLQQQMTEIEETIVPQVEDKPIIVQSIPTVRTIAPKPAVSKLIGGTSGQQIVFIQAPSTQAGQTMRLISNNTGSTPTGSFQLVKRADGVMQLKQTKVLTTPIKKIAPAPLNKNLLTKVLVKGNNQVVIGSSSEPPTNAIKILPLNTSVANTIKLTSPAKTITLAQAQNMGLIRSGANKVQVLSGKVGIKAPMKILPAPSQSISSIKSVSNQNIIIKQGNIRPLSKPTLLVTKSATGTVQTITMPSSLIKTLKPSTQVPVVKTPVSTQPQVIKIQAGQNAASGQLHQINVPGRGIQYVRLVSNTTPSVTSTQTQATKTATFTTKPILKYATTGIKTIKSAMVGIRPALTGNKTLVTTKPTIVKAADKPPESEVIVISKPTSTITSSTATTTNAVSSTSKVNQEIMPKEIKTTAQFLQELQQRQNVDAENKFQVPMEIDPDDLIEERMPAYGQPIYKYLKQEIKRGLSLENLSLLDKRGKDIIEANGIRPRKPCNCTRSQCLKLYCDCFANGEFCNMCNCKDCMNNIENEDERQKAIRSCLDRNPSAFRPKIGKAKDPGLEPIRRHNKGCNCKRSGCLKNYCECFEAKIACSNNCKCVGCRNIEDCLERKRSWAEDLDGSYKKFASNEEEYAWGSILGKDLGKNYKWPVNYITPDVIEATCQCLIAQADEAVKSNTKDEKVVDEILEEFGHCLVQIIKCFNKSNAAREESS